MPKRKGVSESRELDLLDDMLTALVDILEEKGFVTHEEWEKRIKMKLKERRSLVDFRDLREGEG